MKKKFPFTMSTTQTILLSFLIAILVGSFLLALPISSASGQAIPYIDILFMATSFICVNGLVTMPTVLTWSFFGQVIILILIQIGGLGIITVISGLMISLHRKIGLSDRILIQDSLNLNTLSGLVKFIKKILIGTFAVEGIGALLYMFVFVPKYGARGIWISIFHAVSAFCNAGIDIIPENDLCIYALDPFMNIVTSLLIILGGIGFIVWWDVIRVSKNIKRQKWKCFCGLTLHSKIALSMSGFLIFAGATIFLILEYNNPLTIKDYSLIDKIQVALFQSVTTRSAGFATIPQQNLTNASTFVSLLLMFIGGSPVGTAGGIKTVTFAVLMLSAFMTIRNKEDVTLFHRTISKQAISKAVAVVSMSFIIMFLSTILLAAVTNANALDIVYEAISATTTVGMTRNITPTLNLWGKIIIIITMYLGRVGPISLFIAFKTKKQKTKIIKNPIEEISIG